MDFKRPLLFVYVVRLLLNWNLYERVRLWQQPNTNYCHLFDLSWQQQREEEKSYEQKEIFCGDFRFGIVLASCYSDCDGGRETKAERFPFITQEIDDNIDGCFQQRCDSMRRKKRFSDWNGMKWWDTFGSSYFPTFFFQFSLLDVRSFLLNRISIESSRFSLFRSIQNLLYCFDCVLFLILFILVWNPSPLFFHSYGMLASETKAKYIHSHELSEGWFRFGFCDDRNDKMCKIF